MSALLMHVAKDSHILAELEWALELLNMAFKGIRAKCRSQPEIDASDVGFQEQL